MANVERVSTAFHRDREVYGPLHDMITLHTDIPGFDLRDEYYALAVLIQELHLAPEITERALEERVAANLLTYALEKDTTEFDLNYVLKREGSGWQLTTADHISFDCLTQMALSAAKKTRDQGGDVGYEAAMVWGVHNTKQILAKGQPGDRLLLIYPPHGENRQSMIYSYTVDSVSEATKTIRVQGIASSLNLVGTQALHHYLHPAQNPPTLHESIAYPFPIDMSFDEIKQAARWFELDPANNTGVSFENRFQASDLPVRYFKQISASAQFLSQVIQETYRQNEGAALTQSQLNQLELAFSFARRAILAAPEGKYVTSGKLRKLFHRKIYLDTVLVENDLYTQEYNQDIRGIFGDTVAYTEPDTGCKSVFLSGLLAGYQGNTIDSPVIHATEVQCAKRVCRGCGNEDIPDNATECPKCHWAPGKPIPSTSQPNQKAQSHARQQIQEERLAAIKYKSSQRKTEATPTLLEFLFGIKANKN